jgi:hypothetical protein
VREASLGSGAHNLVPSAPVLPFLSAVAAVETAAYVFTGAYAQTNETATRGIDVKFEALVNRHSTAR